MQVTEKINHWGKQIEVIKPALFVDTIKLSNKQSALAKQENNKGTYTVAYGKNVIGKTKNGYKVDFIGSHPSKEYFNTRIGSNKILKNKQYKKATGYTLKSFMENNPVGRFVLIVQGHAVAVVNGVINDTYDCSRDATRCVYGYWQK